jgi:hypothetical protein
VARVIDVSPVLGAKVFCETGPAADPMDRPLTVEVEFALQAWSNKHVHPCGVQELRELRSLRNEKYKLKQSSRISRSTATSSRRLSEKL